MRALLVAVALTVAAPTPVHQRDPWPRLVRCETGGTMNWRIVSRSGRYRGGIQADAGFWRTYGGWAFAPFADKASPTQQITVAIRARDGWPVAPDPAARRSRRYSPWPTCARQLGLPR